MQKVQKFVVMCNCELMKIKLFQPQGLTQVLTFLLKIHDPLR